MTLLVACTRPQSEGFATAHPDASVETIHIATMRTAGQRAQMFGETRSSQMSYVRASISIPPVHKLGQIERARGPANTARHFAPLGVTSLTNEAQLLASLRAKQGSRDEPLLIYVHGYNNTLEDAAFRLAQIQHDFELANSALLFSWPSAGDPLGYAYDRDSVLFARSDLADLLKSLDTAGERNVMILAHSMGSYLVMEALRQLALEGRGQTVQNLEGVILMSPDIDPDVFRKQAGEIGKLPEPFVIMTSQNDRVLNLSSLLSGRKERLGRIRNADEVEGLNVTVMDFTLFEPGENMGHMVPVSSPKAIRLLRRLADGISLASTEFSKYVLLGDSKRRRAAQ